MVLGPSFNRFRLLLPEAVLRVDVSHERMHPPPQIILANHTTSWNVHFSYYLRRQQGQRRLNAPMFPAEAATITQSTSTQPGPAAYPTDTGRATQGFQADKRRKAAASQGLASSVPPPPRLNISKKPLPSLDPSMRGPQKPAHQVGAADKQRKLPLPFQEDHHQSPTQFRSGQLQSLRRIPPDTADRQPSTPEQPDMGARASTPVHTQENRSNDLGRGFSREGNRLEEEHSIDQLKESSTTRDRFSDHFTHDLESEDQSEVKSLIDQSEDETAADQLTEESSNTLDWLADQATQSRESRGRSEEESLADQPEKEASINQSGKEPAITKDWPLNQFTHNREDDGQLEKKSFTDQLEEENSISTNRFPGQNAHDRDSEGQPEGDSSIDRPEETVIPDRSSGQATHNREIAKIPDLERPRLDWVKFLIHQHPGELPKSRVLDPVLTLTHF